MSAVGDDIYIFGGETDPIPPFPPGAYSNEMWKFSGDEDSWPCSPLFPIDIQAFPSFSGRNRDACAWHSNVSSCQFRAKDGTGEGGRERTPVCRYAYRSKARFHVWMQNLTSCEMACQHQDASNMTVISCTPMFPHHNDLFIGSHTTIPLCLVHVLPTRNLTLCCICL